MTGTVPAEVINLLTSGSLETCRLSELICNQANTDFTVSEESVLTFVMSLNLVDGNTGLSFDGDNAGICEP